MDFVDEAVLWIGLCCALNDNPSKESLHSHLRFDLIVPSLLERDDCLTRGTRIPRCCRHDKWSEATTPTIYFVVLRPAVGSGLAELISSAELTVFCILHSSRYCSTRRYVHGTRLARTKITGKKIRCSLFFLQYYYWSSVGYTVHRYLASTYFMRTTFMQLRLCWCPGSPAKPLERVGWALS